MIRKLIDIAELRNAIENGLETVPVYEVDFERIVERPKGKWARHFTGLIFKREWGRCLECGNILDFNGVNAGRGDANFCPNCGADMRGG